LLDFPPAKKVDDKTTELTFSIAETTLREKGLIFITPLVPHYTNFNIQRAWVVDSEQKVPGYGYFSGQLLNAIDLAVAEGILNGAAAVPVKIDLSKYDDLTGLANVYKNLQVILHFYNDANVPCE